MNKTEYNALANTKLFSGCTSKELESIFAVATPYTKTYKRDEIVMNQGEKTRQVGILTRGRLLATKYHYDGNPQILRILNPGDLVGLVQTADTEFQSPEVLVADKTCQIIYLRYSDIFASGRIREELKIKILQNAIRILADVNIAAQYTIDALSHYTIRDRVMAYLQVLCEMEETKTIDIGMSQVQFAQYLRVNRSVLSKELNKMRKEGLIDFNETTYTVL